MNSGNQLTDNIQEIEITPEKNSAQLFLSSLTEVFKYRSKKRWTSKFRYYPQTLWMVILKVSVALVHTWISIAAIIFLILHSFGHDQTNGITFLSNYYLLFFILITCWYWKVAYDSREYTNAKHLLAKLIESNASGSHDLHLELFNYVATKYQIGVDKIKVEMPVEFIVDVLCNNKDIERLETSQLTERVCNSARTATDFLCVISAHSKTKFLQAEHFDSQLRYYKKFDRVERPRDRITRVFSVPVNLSEGQAIWCDDQKCTYSLGEQQREMLAIFLWVNQYIGIDTKLHFFNPSLFDSARKERVPQFFEGADYVLSREPAQLELHKQHVLFIAYPDNETECVEIKNNAGICRLFQYEFYSRLTNAHDSGSSSERIYEVRRDDWTPILKALKLDSCKNRSMLKEKLIATVKASAAMDTSGKKWANDEAILVGNRWDEWNACSL